MSEMVEKVSRALCVAFGQDPDFNYDPQGKFRTDDIRWKLYESKALAAIEAVRDYLKKSGCDTGSVIHIINVALNAEEREP